jgi:hypothetical protein
MRGTWQTTDSGGGGLVLAVIAAVVLAGSGAATAAVSAIVTIAITLAAVVAVAVAGVIGLIVYRARSEGRRRLTGAPAAYQVPPESRPQLWESHKPAAVHFAGPSRPHGGNLDQRNGPRFGPPAIEPPQLHLHFHGLSPAEVAEAIRQANERE